MTNIDWSAKALELTNAAYLKYELTTHAAEELQKEIQKVLENAYKQGNEESMIDLENGFFLSKGMQPNRVWIGKEDGEGGDFDIADLVAKHYEEHL